MEDSELPMNVTIEKQNVNCREKYIGDLQAQYLDKDITNCTINLPGENAHFFAQSNYMLQAGCLRRSNTLCHSCIRCR